LLVAGFAKVEELIARGRAVLLLHAADGAPDGAEKLSRKFRAQMAVDGGVARAGQAIVTELAGEQLDLAMGRSNVVHAAATEGGAARRILQEAGRLRRYRSEEPRQEADS
jgi:hypothetical protein